MPEILLEDEPKLITLRELEDYGKCALGFKLLVKCLEATYLGVCHHILSNSRQLFLENVFIHPSGRGRLGLTALFYMDIVSIKFIGVDRGIRARLWKDYGLDKSTSGNALMGQILPPSSFEENEEGRGSLFTPQDVSSDVGDDVMETLLPNFPRELLKDILWRVVDKFGVDYERCMHDCKSSSVVSIGGFGKNLGRNGELIWLAVEARDSVYLFDIPKFGGAPVVLKSAIGKLLGDAKIEKIVHDFRKFNDLLSHQHKIEASNVFDTQASDIYLHSFQHNEMPLLVRTLPALLTSYLHFDKTDVRSLVPQVDDESRWLERPLPVELSILMIHSVMFLRNLKGAMMDLLHQDLNHLNNLFVTSLKTLKSDDNFDELLVPLEVQSLYKGSLLPSTMRKRHSKKAVH